MRIIQNSNLAFRCPENLKKKLEAYAEETDVHVSAIVRTARISGKCGGIAWFQIELVPQLIVKPAFYNQFT